MQEHIEGYLELSAKTKTYFTTAVALWDADFYVKVDDDVHVNIGKVIIRPFPFLKKIFCEFFFFLLSQVCGCDYSYTWSNLS